MRHSFIFLIPLLAAVLTPFPSFGSDQSKLKHVNSSYADAAQIGLKSPEGVSCNDPYLYVADTGNSRLLRYTYQDGALLVDKVFPAGNVVPIQVQVNSRAEFYLLDGKARQIVRLDTAGNPKGTLSLKGVPGTQKVVPKSFRIDGRDNLYILDLFSERVLVVDGEGTFQSQLAFPEDYGFISDLALDEKGAVYLLDSVRVAVHKADRGGEFRALTTGLKSYVNFPTYLTVDERGRIFVVDQYGSGLVLLAADGSFAGRKLGMGWDEGFLYYPAQVCLNAAGDLFIADRNNSRVQQFMQIE